MEILAIIGACGLAWSSLSGCSKASDESAQAAHAHDHDEGEHDHDANDDHDHASHDDDAHADVDHQSDADIGDDATPVASPDIYPGVLGEIVVLPIANDPSSSLQIRHMQIPNFKTKDGTVHVNAEGISGMRSMTMPFPIEEGVDITGLAVGDKIMFTFMVDWSGNSGNAWAVTKIEKMPADTVIDFSNTIVPQDSPVDEGP